MTNDLLPDDIAQRRPCGSIGPGDDGGTVVVAGFVEDLRNLGNIAFLTVRDRSGKVQLTLLKKKMPELFALASSLSRESVVAATAKVQRSEKANAGFELLPSQLRLLGAAESPLPLGPADAVGVEVETALNNRFLDLRRPQTMAVFLCRAAILRGVREQLQQEDFIEVQTPKIVATATEGGAGLFPMQYFERKAYLNQSPQLYKQILMASGLDRVWEVGPAFRAEEHNTTRHLNEFTSIDIEMAYADDEAVMGVLERVLQAAMRSLNEHAPDALRTLGVTLVPPQLPLPRITYDHCRALAAKRDITVAFGEDLSMEVLRAIADELPDLYFITRWPSAAKPFYIRPVPDSPQHSFAFDLQYREKEITSGGQRVHDVGMLQQRLLDQGLDPEAFAYYLKAFRYGMPPHAGWGLGADRLTLILTQRENVRECVLFPRDRERIVP